MQELEKRELHILRELVAANVPSNLEAPGLHGSERSRKWHWLRVFGQEPPSSAIRSFYADIFEITVPAERELQLKAKNERILEWRRSLDNGAQEIEVSPRDIWQCLARLKKGKSSPDGVTTEMLLALPEEQIVCLARNIQNMFSVSHSKKTTSERPQRVPSHQLPDHIS